MIAPFLVRPQEDEYFRKRVAEYFCSKISSSCLAPLIDDDIYHTMRIQFEALGLVAVKYTRTLQGGAALFWSLTTEGVQQMMALRSVRAVES
jgi:hypothetical protein